MGGRGSRGIDSDRGATVVEFAVVVVLVMSVLLGVLQYGYHFWALETASASAREAARRLAVGADPRPSGCALTQAASRAAAPAVGPVVATASTVAPAVGDVVTVTVGFQSLSLHLPFLPLPGDGWVQESARATVESVHSGTQVDPYVGC